MDLSASQAARLLVVGSCALMAVLYVYDNNRSSSNNFRRALRSLAPTASPSAGTEEAVITSATALTSSSHPEGVSDKWTYTWPYGPGGSCRCVKAPWGLFESEGRCLVAFAADNWESCTHDAVPVDAKQCRHAVSIDQLHTNEECILLCEKAAAADEGSKDFFRSCAIEKVAIASDKVVSLGSCFTNNVIGHSDRSYLKAVEGGVSFSVASAVYPDTRSASECQNYCQTNSDCDSWLWRALRDSPQEVQIQQEENSLAGTAQVCYLKTTEMRDGASGTVLHIKALKAGELPPYSDEVWKFCDVESKWSEIKPTYSDAVELCECGCEWRSSRHLAGPKFCKGP